MSHLIRTGEYFEQSELQFSRFYCTIQHNTIQYNILHLSIIDYSQMTLERFKTCLTEL